jgi:Zn-dependent protease with chaperone function
MSYLDWIGPALVPIILLSFAGCAFVLVSARGSSSLRRLIAAAFLLSLAVVLGTHWIKVPVAATPITHVEQAAVQASIQARDSWSWQWLAFLPAAFVGIRHLTGLLSLVLSRRKFRKGPVGLTSDRLFICDRAKTAYAYGALKPTIVLPASYLDLEPAALIAIVRHEEAHLRQGDPTLIPIISLLQGLLWWNPFVHLLAHAWRIESERAADDAALASGIPPARYARHLIVLAQGLAGRTPLAGSAFIGRGRLKTRILAVVNPDVRRKKMKVSHKYMTITGCMAVALALSVAASARWNSAQTNPSGVKPQEEARWEAVTVEGVPLQGKLSPVVSDQNKPTGKKAKESPTSWRFEGTAEDGTKLEGKAVEGQLYERVPVEEGENGVWTRIDGDTELVKGRIVQETPKK